MFSKTRQIFRGLSAPFRLAWALLIGGMVLFVGGMLPLDWPTVWPGVGCLFIGVFLTGLAPRDRDDPNSTDGSFRSAVFISLLLTPTVLLVLFAIIIAFCGLVVGLFAGFEFSLLVVGVRMLLMALVYSFVTGIPAYASNQQRPRRIP